MSALPKLIPVDNLLKHFRHKKPREPQLRMIEHIVKHDLCAIVEGEPGIGKTDVGLAVIDYLAEHGQGSVYLAPTKNLVEQVEQAIDQPVKMLGRSEYECLFYTDNGVPDVTAQESPCYMLPCDHRVDQETGETAEEGATPCPYYQAKFEALARIRGGATTVCTTAYWLMNRLCVPAWRDLEPGLVIVDEVHGIAKVARSIFEVTMTDYHLYRVADVLDQVDGEQAGLLRDFVKAFQRIARSKDRPSGEHALLKDEEIGRLIAKLEEMSVSRLKTAVGSAVKKGLLNPITQKFELKLLQDLVHGLPRMINSLNYAVETDEHKPLNMVVAFYYKEEDEVSPGVTFADSKKQARYRLTIKPYYVAPLIRKALGSKVLGYSATICDPLIFGHETGLRQPFISVGTDFPVENTRVYMPTDTSNLSHAVIKDDKQFARRLLNPALKTIADSAAVFIKKGHRSLVVVSSERERKKFVELAAANHPALAIVTYGDAMRPKEAVEAFREGEGHLLLGTAAQFSEGINLPKGIAPVIFYLRPSFPRPDDPMAQFEQRRFGKKTKGGYATPWPLWIWRASLEALQVRGRNVRSAKDKGVTFFISQQFRNFLMGRLPNHLKPAYRGELTMEQAVGDALKLLG